MRVLLAAVLMTAVEAMLTSPLASSRSAVITSLRTRQQTMIFGNSGSGKKKGADGDELAFKDPDSLTEDEVMPRALDQPVISPLDRPIHLMDANAGAQT